MIRQSKSQVKKSFLTSCLEGWFSSILVARLVAILAVFNFFLVLFDLSYIPLRDFWLHGQVRLGYLELGPIKSEGIYLELLPPSLSKFIVQYDVIKGILPYKDTEEYLKTVEELKGRIDNLNSPEVANILSDLRRRSKEMIETNPFQLANKTGALEKIKSRMRRYVVTPDNSAKKSFEKFWTQEHLKGKTVQEIEFFEQKIQPLIETNYYRSIGENGEFIDYFELIDFPFFVIFVIDFLGRTWLISHSYSSVRWKDAIFWRWYDVFLLIPVFRWLRIIPVLVRLNQANLIDLHAIQNQISQGVVATIAEDLTEIVIIRIIGRLQDSIRKGEVTQKLLQYHNQTYVDINNTNEVAEITKLMAKLMINQVLPKVRPDVEAVLAYNIEKVLKQCSPQLPGGEFLQKKLIEQLVQRLYEGIYNSLDNILEEDPVLDELLERLVKNIRQAIGSEIQAKQSLEKLESLLIDLLEELKINYIQSLSEEDVETILEQTRKMRQIVNN